MVEAVVVAAVVKIAVAMVIAATNPRPIATTVQPHEEETVELRVQQVGAHCFVPLRLSFWHYLSFGRDQHPLWARTSPQYRIVVSRIAHMLNACMIELVPLLCNHAPISSKITHGPTPFFKEVKPEWATTESLWHCLW